MSIDRGHGIATSSVLADSYDLDGIIAKYEQFADTYLGHKAVEPTTDDDGDALIVGALYFNTVDNELRVYDGTDWQAVYAGALKVNNFTGDGATVAYTLTTAPNNENSTQVYIDGVYQQKDTYTTVGAVLTFSEAPPTSAGIEVMIISSFEVSTAEAQNVTYTQGGTGASSRTVENKLQESVSVKDFGAVGDGVTDDTAAIQAAIDYCISNNKDLSVSGMCLLTAPINIDRQVDGADFDHWFTISSFSGGGFIVKTAINMFSSTIVDASSPVTQLTKFLNLKFETDNNALAAYVIDGHKFLRTTFEGCNFRKIKCLLATTVYTQSIYLINCQARRFTGTFFSSQATTFDLQVLNVLIEAGLDAFDIANAVGCRFYATIEGMLGTAIKIDGSQGVSIQGYFEGNGTSIDLTVGDHYGVSLNGCLFSAAPSSSITSSVLWGHAVGCSSDGCLGTGVDGRGLHSLASNSEVFINDFGIGASTIDIHGYSRYRHGQMAIGLNSPSNNVAGALATFATSVMTVTTAPTSGAFAVGQNINAIGIPNHVKIASLGTGTGGTGTYNLNMATATAIPTPISVTVSNNLHVHGGLNTTFVLTDEGLGTDYGAAIQGRGLSGLGAEMSLGVLSNGVFVERALFNNGGGFGIGGLLATNATEGHLSIPTCAGSPTGVPNNVLTGTSAIQYDTSTNKLWVYNSGWKATTLA